jgi:hypothetical protein
MALKRPKNPRTTSTEAPLQFYYLNHDMVQAFLSQIEGGTFQSVEQRVQISKHAGVDVATGLGPGVKVGAASESEETRVLLQTHQSDFQRFRVALQRGGWLRPLPTEPISEHTWSILRVGEFVEIDAELPRSDGTQAKLRAALMRLPQRNAVEEEDPDPRQLTVGVRTSKGYGFWASPQRSYFVDSPVEFRPRWKWFKRLDSQFLRWPESVRVLGMIQALHPAAQTSQESSLSLPEKLLQTHPVLTSGSGELLLLAVYH